MTEWPSLVLVLSPLAVIQLLEIVRTAVAHADGAEDKAAFKDLGLKITSAFREAVS